MDKSQAAVKKRAKKLAHLIVRKGMKATDAMRQVGYSDAQASKGFPSMMKRAAVRTALQKELSRFAAETEGVPGAAERAKMIRARLVMNIASGQDKAVASCKLAGMDRELNLYHSEVQNNMILVNLASLGEIEEK